MRLFVDRIHRLPRIWSNRELDRFARLFHGDIVNVSGWQDIDKEGRHYKDYFQNADSYTITNYKAEARGFQGLSNEVFLDLEADLPRELYYRFDAVFNHTTLEHIYSVHKAFRNLCDMTKDVVILVLPFMQQYHADYGDYWRLTPLAVKRMFEDNGFTILYQSFNTHSMSSVYTFTIASRCPEKWEGYFDWSFSLVDQRGCSSEPFIGCHAIPKGALGRLIGRLLDLFQWLFHRPDKHSYPRK
ncbi:MAG: hypothetical protein ACLPN1_04800 [Dissulfurispiraceae bacterium]